MKFVIIIQKRLMMLLGVLFIGAGLLASMEQASAQPSWMPNPPKAIAGTSCDEDPAWMRKWHMKALDHKRDETMYDGIRTKKYSLKNCITCHAVKTEAVKGEPGKFLTVKDERHFCRSCHDYTAVRIDCFDCHASRPTDKMEKAAAAANPHQLAKAHASFSDKKKMGTALAALQKYMAGEGK